MRTVSRILDTLYDAAAWLAAAFIFAIFSPASNVLALPGAAAFSKPLAY